MSLTDIKQPPKAGAGVVFACCSPLILDFVKEAVVKCGKRGFDWAPSYVQIMAKLDTKPAELVVVEYIQEDKPGFETLAAYLSKKNVAFIVICRQAAEGFDGLRLGAVNMLVIREATAAEVESQSPFRFFVSSLAAMIRGAGAAGKETRSLKSNIIAPITKIIAIGASTGGAEAVIRILRDIPADAPPIIVAMHMPPVFTKIYAERLNALCAVTAWEAENGDRLRPGLALVAKGDKHMVLNKDSGGYYVSINEDPPVGGFRPSVDRFFESAAKCARSSVIGVILTGMGSDGAKGMVALTKAGAHTIGQDEATSVVYGMPKAAYALGAVSVQAPVQDIAARIMDAVRTR